MSGSRFPSSQQVLLLALMQRPAVPRAPEFTDEDKQVFDKKREIIVRHEKHAHAKHQHNVHQPTARGVGRR